MITFATKSIIVNSFLSNRVHLFLIGLIVYGISRSKGFWMLTDRDKP